MSEITDNTLTAYLGPEFQQHLMWQLLVEPEYAEKTIPLLAIEYFDDPNLKRLFIVILEFLKEYHKVPNLQNQSIRQAINKYKTPNNVIEEESLFSTINRIELWNQRIINKELLHNGDVIRKATNTFIKQQEYRKIGEFILDKTKNGEIKGKNTIARIEERFQKAAHIGEEADDCEEVIDNIDTALRMEFRQTIATGIEVIDSLTGGGLGKGEIGLILTPSGVGKTTILTKIANTAYEDEKNVAQIIFEDSKDQIKRKHYTIWTGIALSETDNNLELARERTHKKADSLRGKGRLVIKKFSQEDTTIKHVRDWMVGYEKNYNMKFDILVLDYLDCLESHKDSKDRNEDELAIIKGFETLASDFDIPCWSAIQSNRSGFDAEYVHAGQSGGSIKRVQKAHFFMSVAKTQTQKEAHLANIMILKARFASDGQVFNDVLFNNDTMEIRIEDDRYKYNKLGKGKKKYGEVDLSNMETKASDMSKINVAVGSPYSVYDAIDRANIETVGDVKTDALFADMTSKHNEFKGLTPNDGFNKPMGIDVEAEITKMAVDETTIQCGIDVHDELNKMLRGDADFISKMEEIEENQKLAQISVDIVHEGATEGATEGISEGVIKGIKHVNPNDTVNDTVRDAVNEGANEGANWHPEADFHEQQIIEDSEIVGDIEDFLLDPDAVIESSDSVKNILLKERDKQNVLKKA